LSGIHPFSPPQLVGYIVFLLGATAFLQKDDRRLKFFNSVQSFFYAVHFVLLGNFPAASSGAVSSVRSMLALRYRSYALVAVLIGASVISGLFFAHGPAGWLPVFATILSTYAMFRMDGIPMRLVLLSCTLMWIVNNILSRSIGGTMVELFIATANITTMLRVYRDRAVSPAPALAESER
jgi:hypothetical protein